MEQIALAPDFKEFLKLLRVHEVEYLLVGGYAVGFHGYPRTTNDLDVWVSPNTENANRLVLAFQEFGFSQDVIRSELFLKREHVLRIGVAPICIDVLKEVSGLDFDSSYNNRVVITVDDFDVFLIGLDDLKKNKLASGRHKDLNDLENLQ